LKVDFVLSANELANPGERTVYIRITSPDGYLLTTDAATFDFEGSPTIYTASREVDYQNDDLDVGLYYNGDGITQDYAEAAKWYQKAAEQGNASAQANLGYMYERGDGVAQDDTVAVKWYRQAAEQGHASAQNNLGNIYYNGKGVTKDDAQALKWYRQAAEPAVF
jgi:hypothetical protein